MKEKNKIVILVLIQLKKVTPLKLKVMTEMMMVIIRRMMIVIRMMILVTTMMSKLRILAMIIEKKM